MSHLPDWSISFPHQLALAPSFGFLLRWTVEVWDIHQLGKAKRCFFDVYQPQKNKNIVHMHQKTCSKKYLNLVTLSLVDLLRFVAPNIVSTPIDPQNCSYLASNNLCSWFIVKGHGFIGIIKTNVLKSVCSLPSSNIWCAGKFSV